MTDVATPPPVSAPAADRVISPVAGRFGAGWLGKGAAMTALMVGCGIFLAATWKHGPSKAQAVTLGPAQQVVPFEPASTATQSAPTLAAPGVAGKPPILDPTASPTVPAPQPAAAIAPAGAAHPSPLEAIRAAPMLAFSAGGSAPMAFPAVLPAPAAPTAEAAATELDQLRRGSTIGLARASRLPDRNFLITAGTAIPCTLQTAMDTATPGYVSCLIGQDVYSDNGAVILLDKGTKVLGEYRSSLRQGQQRLFILWTRAVTPAGVAIGLASPASDTLGRAGFDGSINNHFWERFGGALLLSIVDDSTTAIASRDPSGQTLRVPSDAAAVALQNSINIPPSLRKAQGAEVAIFAAQDFDFSGVYGLRSH